MRISNHRQGSQEWLNERKGIPTASEFAPFMIEAKTAAAQDARKKYLCGKITETFDNDEFEQQAEDKASRFMDSDPWIQRGKHLESFARKALCKRIDREIVETGLIFHDCGGFAASPDGLVIGEDGDTWESGCEIKCHNRKRHLADLLSGVLPSDHKFQVHGCMAVTGIRKWHYFGFYPSQPSLHVVVEWDDFTDQLLAGLIKLTEEKDAMKRRLRELWNTEMKEVDS